MHSAATTDLESQSRLVPHSDRMFAAALHNLRGTCRSAGTMSNHSLGTMSSSSMPPLRSGIRKRQARWSSDWAVQNSIPSRWHYEGMEVGPLPLGEQRPQEVGPLPLPVHPSAAGSGSEAGDHGDTPQSQSTRLVAHTTTWEATEGGDGQTLASQECIKSHDAQPKLPAAPKVVALQHKPALNDNSELGGISEAKVDQSSPPVTASTCECDRHLIMLPPVTGHLRSMAPSGPLKRGIPSSVRASSEYRQVTHARSEFTKLPVSSQPTKVGTHPTDPTSVGRSSLLHVYLPT